MLPFELTKDTPYLALSGELWSVFYEYINRNWPCYKGFLLYMDSNYKYKVVYKGLIFIAGMPISRKIVVILKRASGANKHHRPTLHKLLTKLEELWLEPGGWNGLSQQYE